MKAAYLYNFARFVEWPSTSGESPFSICVAAPERKVEIYRQALEGKRIGNRAIRVLSADARSGGHECEILFIAKERAPSRHLASTAGRPTLTVGESEKFVESGGIIEFIEEGGSLRFEVNLSEAKRSNLVISSQMLQFARRVRGG